MMVPTSIIAAVLLHCDMARPDVALWGAGRRKQKLQLHILVIPLQCQLYAV